MTLPIEELRALKRTHELLRRLITSNLTTIRKEARAIREEAGSCIHHYPFDCHLDQMYKERMK